MSDEQGGPDTPTQSFTAPGSPEEPAPEPELVALFVAELAGGVPRLQELVLALEHADDPAPDGEEAMRLAHSLKGAARIVGLSGVVGALHAAEDTLSAVARGRELGAPQAQRLLELVDLLEQVSALPPAAVAAWIGRKAPALQQIAAALQRRPSVAPPSGEGITEGRGASLEVSLGASAPALVAYEKPRAGTREIDARMQRVSAESLARMLGLAGESVVETRRLGAPQRGALALERLQRRLAERSSELLAHARGSGDASLVSLAEGMQADVAQATQLTTDARNLTGESLQRLRDVGERLYIESLKVRQRPFAQLVPALRRQVRDAALALGKDARLELSGAATLVDADVLAALDSVLHHLVTNAIDHGLEPPAERSTLGKSAHGTLRVEVRSARGQLELLVADDGRGIELEKLREAVVTRKLVAVDTAPSLTESELFEFLFLPGFSTAGRVSVHSGRGVGLDSVRSDLTRIGGRIQISSEAGKGTRFELALPVTRVVVRALLFSVGGDSFALPLARTGRVVRLATSELRSTEGREYADVDGENVGLLRADELLELAVPAAPSDDLTVVLLGDPGAHYGLVVDRQVAEDDLVVRPLDPRLQRVPDVAATALLADGSPAVLLDADDLMRSIEKHSRRQRPSRKVARAAPAAVAARRVLVVDDSLTVREVERQLLEARGYFVDVAVDGLDGWTMLSAQDYDLLVADVDMPRMDGLELVRRVRAEQRLARLPVIIVSYKDREEDRKRGLEVGADYYLGKGSFHDDQLVNAVRDLIGDAT